jgi:hypothetical protein
MSKIIHCFEFGIVLGGIMWACLPVGRLWVVYNKFKSKQNDWICE